MYFLEQGNVDDDASFITIFLVSFNLQSCCLVQSPVCKCHTLKWKCTLVGSHWYYGVFIYMISTSYFLGKDAHQVNGFVQDFLILFFNSTLKWMNVGINFQFNCCVDWASCCSVRNVKFKNWKGRVQRIWKWCLPICVSPSLSVKVPTPWFLLGFVWVVVYKCTLKLLLL